MKNRGWEAHTDLRTGLARIVFDTGEVLVIRNDGSVGYEFVEEYIKELHIHYPSHLEAVDKKTSATFGAYV